jgi:hypothetical protein
MAGAIQLRVQLEHRPVRSVGRKRRAGIQKISILKFWRDLVVALSLLQHSKRGHTRPPPLVHHPCPRPSTARTSNPSVLPAHLRLIPVATAAVVMPIAFRPAAKARSVELPAACSCLMVGARSAARDATRFSMAWHRAPGRGLSWSAAEVCSFFNLFYCRTVSCGTVTISHSGCCVLDPQQWRIKTNQDSSPTK